MRVAVLADIHGNLAALEAALEDIAKVGADQVVVAGDVVNGAPDSRACWELIRSLGHPTLRGNHERYLFDLGTPRASPEWETERFRAVHWARRQFSRDELEEMRSLPLCHRPPGTEELLIVHAAPGRDNENVQAYTAESELERMFGGTRERLIVRGHNHIGNTRRLGERWIVTAGSVGMPQDGNPTAQYLLLERTRRGWSWEHRSVRYDVEETLRRFRDAGYLLEAGAMARLIMREIATGSHQMVPFLRWWQSRAEALPDLSAAVDRFLTAY
jgi:predicted phosphodiesterase